MRLLFVVICLLGGVARGEESVVSFARESLGLNIADIRFGAAMGTNGEFSKTTPPLSNIQLPDGNGMTWFEGATSVKYHHEFENRILKFGFRDGKLETVRVSISVFGGTGFEGVSSTQEVFDQRRKGMVKIHEAYMKMRTAQKSAPKAESYEIRYGAMCSPTPESLFVMELQITKAESKALFKPPQLFPDVDPDR